MLIVAQPALACIGDCNLDRAVTVNELLGGVNISLGRADVGTCYSFDRDGNGQVTVAELIAGVRSALSGCVSETRAFVVTSDFTTGSFATVGIDPPNPVMASSPRHLIYRDAVVREHDGLVYVVNRLFADNIQVLDPANGFATRMQCSVGAATNPHDIAIVDSTKAYVTRLEVPDLLIVNPSAQPNCSDFVRGSINLASLADRDGNPDMDQMALVDGRLYVALERLDINRILRTPARNAALAVIDVATDTLIGSIELDGLNPFGATKGITVRGGSLYLPEPGYFGKMDGGIERVDLASQATQGFVITEEELGGDITDFVLVSDHLGYAIVGEPGFRNALVSFDLTTRQVTGTLHSANGATLFDIELNDRGELYVADRARQNSGIRIFRADDGTPIGGPFNLVLPPFEIVFLP